ncbi:MAG: CopG family transcriptional regulator [Burkholderiales bacterium]|nr:CopG family transcriptional regulator [Burkholderiales bacterium]
MSTTTIRIPPALKARASRAAEHAGITTHAFVLEALEQRVLQAEARAAFLREGGKRLVEMEAEGVAVPWDEVRAWLLDRAAGKVAPRPAARRAGAGGVEPVAPRKRAAGARKPGAGRSKPA